MNTHYHSIDVPDEYITTATAARHLGVAEETIEAILRIVAWGVDGCAHDHAYDCRYAQRVSTSSSSEVTVWHTSTLLEVVTFALRSGDTIQSKAQPSQVHREPSIAETFCTYTREDDLAAGFGIPPEMFHEAFLTLIERGWRCEEEIIELGDVYVDERGERWYYRPFVISEMVDCRF